MNEQLLIKVRIHLKDIDISFFTKLHQGTTFRNVLEIIHDGQFYENFNKSEYCALFYQNSYIQDREALIIRNFQLQYMELKSSINVQNSDIYTLEFIRNQEFTQRKQTAFEANNNQDQIYQQTQSEIRIEQESRKDDQFKQYEQQNAYFPLNNVGDFNKICEIENKNQPSSDQIEKSQLLKNQNDRVSNPSVIKPQQQQIINSQQRNINNDESDLYQVQYIQSKEFLNETQHIQLRLIRFISLNSLRVDIDDFESIKTVHLIGYENSNLKQIKDFVLRQTNQYGKSVLIKFNQNDDIDQSTILRKNQNYIRLYLNDRQLKKYSIHYSFNQNNEYFQLVFSEILPEGLENEQINNQYYVQNQQGKIIQDKIIFGVEKNQNLVKQHSFIFQYQGLVIFKYELKQFSKSNQDPTEIFEAFFRSKFNYRQDKNNYVIDI